MKIKFVKAEHEQWHVLQCECMAAHPKEATPMIVRLLPRTGMLKVVCIHCAEDTPLSEVVDRANEV